MRSNDSVISRIMNGDGRRGLERAMGAPRLAVRPYPDITSLPALTVSAGD
ncbi:MAG TPA: hypothetical protein VID72_04035 [Ktedonobacterales bacterium]